MAGDNNYAEVMGEVTGDLEEKEGNQNALKATTITTAKNSV